MCLFLSVLDSMAQVAISDTESSPDPSAMLDVSSTDRGVLIPRLSLSERDAIASPAQGLLVFITDDNRFYAYNGTAWEKVLAGVDSGWNISGSNLVSAVGGNVGIGTSSPAELLDVNGKIFLSGAEPMINFMNNAGTTDRLIIRKNPGSFGEINVLSNHELRMRTNDTDRLIIEEDGDIDMRGNQVKSLRLENRTSDPASPAVGQIWLRTDL